MQYILAAYFVYSSEYTLVQTPNLAIPFLSLLVTESFFLTSASLFLFCKWVHLYHLFSILFLEYSLNICQSTLYAINKVSSQQ